MDIPDGALYRLHRVSNALAGCLARLRLDLLQALGIKLPFALIKAHAHARAFLGPARLFLGEFALFFAEFASAFFSLTRLLFESTLGAAHLLIDPVRHGICPPGSVSPSALL